MRNLVIIQDRQSIAKFTSRLPRSFEFLVSWICNQILPSSTWSFVSKYPTDFLLFLICDIHSCWMWIPITTCKKKHKKRDKKDWMYLPVVRSHIQPVSQRSNLLYNGKGWHKVRYQISVTCNIQMFHWEQHLITHAELSIDLCLP